MAKQSLFCIFAFILLFTACDGESQSVDDMHTSVYVGTYTRGESEGIYHLSLNHKTGELTVPVLVAETANPSFLAVHSSMKFLFAVSEMPDQGQGTSGALSAYAIEEDGSLTFINKMETGSRGPCHVSLNEPGSHAFVAHYGGGSVSVLPVAENGQLSATSGFSQHRGSSVNPERQSAPHAHSVFLDAAQKRVYVADLGLDRIVIYNFDRANGSITEQSYAGVPPGGGPRHFTFHPSGRFAYTNNELTSSVTGFRVDSVTGDLSAFQTISCLPNDFEGSNSTAQILTSNDGRFLYVSNRGHNSIAMYTIDQISGQLEAIGHQSTMGETPRNFNIDPSGRFLIAANQASDNLVVFRINDQTGRLEDTGHRAAVPTPVCIVYRG